MAEEVLGILGFVGYTFVILNYRTSLVGKDGCVLYALWWYGFTGCFLCAWCLDKTV